MSSKTITQHFLAARERSSDALRFKRHKSWLSLSWKDYYLTSEAAAHGLLSLGVDRGDRVAILAQTRFEWAVLDFAILGMGAITVPIYQSNKADEVEFILNHCEAKVLVVEDATQLRKWEAVAKKCKSVERVICLQAVDSNGSVMNWDDLLESGVKDSTSEYERRIANQKRSDLATIVYTSGTTGEPKGVMLNHEQIMSEVEDILEGFPVTSKDSTLSFLPYAHVLGRVELWLHTYVGFTMCLAESIERLKQNLPEVKPTLMIGVPRIFEKIHADILTQIEGHSLRKQAFQFLKGGGFLRQTVADWLIYSRLRESLGGRLRFVVSGGAALDSQLAEFFHKAGLLILEGYGLTETTAAITANRPDDFEFGTVGKPMRDVEIRLADDGEILVRSHKVMRGYYKNEAATEEVLKDGFLSTGDVGEWTARGHLRLTDRKKDLIKTAGGKYIAPQKLEGLLKAHPLISNALIHGERRKYVVALLTLNPAFAKAIAKDNHWTYRDFKALAQLPEMREQVRKAVAQVNSQLASYETIKNFAILNDDFSIEKGELTPSLKVKRRVCDERYKDVLEQLY